MLKDQRPQSDMWSTARWSMQLMTTSHTECCIQVGLLDNLPATLEALPDLLSPLGSVRIALRGQGEKWMENLRERKQQKEKSRGVEGNQVYIEPSVKFQRHSSCLTGWPGRGAVVFLFRSRDVASQRLGRPGQG